MKSTYNKKFICSKCSETERIVWRILKRPCHDINGVLVGALENKTPASYDGDNRIYVSIHCRGVGYTSDEVCDNIVQVCIEEGCYDSSLLDPYAPLMYTQDSEEAAYWEGRENSFSATPTVGWPSP